MWQARQQKYTDARTHVFDVEHVVLEKFNILRTISVFAFDDDQDFVRNTYSNEREHNFEHSSYVKLSDLF